MDENQIIRFLEKQTKKEESLEVLRWIEASEENKEYYKKIHDVWILIQMDTAHEVDKEQINQIMRKIKKQKNKQISLWLTLGSIASALVILIGLNVLFLKRTEQPFNFESLISSVPQSKEITLTVNSGSKVKIEKNRTITLQDSIVNIDYNNKSSNGQITINDSVKVETKFAMNMIRVPFGKRSILILEDSTKVYLNSGSTLIYPSVFSEGEREVYLEGEAYFDVKPDTERRFIVQTTYKSVEVLGTSFNVSVDKEQDIFETVLICGCIAIDEQVKLSPNQCYSYTPSTKKVSIKEVDGNDYISWIEGKLKFKKEPMVKAINKLEKVYNIKIKIKDDKYLESLVSGELNLKESAEETVSVLMSIVNPENKQIRDNTFEIIYIN